AEAARARVAAATLRRVPHARREQARRRVLEGGYRRIPEVGHRVPSSIALRMASLPSGVEAIVWGVRGTNWTDFSLVIFVAQVRPIGTGSPQSCAPNRKVTRVFGYCST